MITGNKKTITFKGLYSSYDHIGSQEQLQESKEQRSEISDKLCSSSKNILPGFQKKKKITFVPLVGFTTIEENTKNYSEQDTFQDKNDSKNFKEFLKYSYDYILSFKEKFQHPPENFISFDIKIPKNFVPNKDLKRKFNKRHDYRSYKKDKGWNRADTFKLTESENAWKPDTTHKSPDIKRIKGILNKLSPDNKDVLLKETKQMDYTDSEVIEIIFNNAISQPFLSEIYAEFVYNLNDLHQMLIYMCEEQFRKKKHKNLCQFIGSLYRRDLVPDISIFVKTLEDDLTEDNIEILCKLIKTVGIKNKTFCSTIQHLDKIKENYKPRHMFMIMDIIDDLE